MISSKVIRWAGLVFLAGAVTASCIFYSHLWSSRSYVKPFATGNGWGYCVYLNNELMIRQDIVPAVQGSMEFPTRRLARQTGLLVLKRVRNGQDPTITEEDLLRLQVLPAQDEKKG